MPQEIPKRAASASPVGDPKRDAKRLRFATDLWSEDEHQRQDEVVKQRLVGKNEKPRKYDTNDETHMAVVLKLVGDVALEGPDSHLFQVPAAIQHYIDALEEDPHLMKLVGESYMSGSYKGVRCLEFYRKKAVSTSSQLVTLNSGQQEAVQQSWERTFSGDAPQALWRHIVEHYGREHTQIYAHYAAIVQSSGMGKSRTVDELGKERFVIPINLRGPDSTGFPPADGEVRDFLATKGGHVEVYGRACAFLEALFEHTAATLRIAFEGIDDTEIVSEFRRRMTEGQTFKNPSPFRVDFYRKVIQNATTKFAKAQEGNTKSFPVYISPNAKGSAYKFPAAQALKDLIDILGDGRQESPTPRWPKTRHSGRTKEDGPLIILAFDEAHTLTELRTTEFTWWSSFTELRHALRALHRFSLFSLFVSTTGKISQFTSARTDDVSSRILAGKLVLIQPFTDLGFDTLARKISLAQAPDLRELTTNVHIAHLGRPLFGSLYDAGDQAVREDIISFAAMKLLNADPKAIQELTDDQRLACLAQRIPLEFNSTTYTAQANERKQVEGHMRVCLNIDAAFESMVTVSASEPLLSEAAYTIMATPSFNVPKAMKSVLEGFSIHKWDRGEFLIMLLFTIARDNAVGPPDQDGLPTQSRIVEIAPFLTKKLFRHHHILKTLHTDFPEARMHFNHYVKVHEYAAIDAESLLLLSSRGGGLLCANSQYAIDGINPFLCRGPKLAFGNLGLILWQGKNDPKFRDDPQQALFDAMDVYNLKILKQGDAAIPIIKIVFALAAQTPSLKVVRHPPSSEYNAIVYDIWCAGISPNTLNAVELLQADTWAALLQASYGWKAIYKGQNVDKTLKRSMNPGAATDIGHWVRWAERSNV